MRLCSAILFSCLFVTGAHASSQQIYLDCLVDFERYAESIWKDNTNAAQPTNSGYWGDGNSNGNGGIRGNCGIAVAYAVLVKANPADLKTPLRISRITKALAYANGTHLTGTKVCVDGKQWGWSTPSSGEWQTPLWSGSLGLACLLVQDRLPPQTILDCQRVVASEATHRAAIAPASGYIGDTKAEENGWDSNILALGAAWMNTHTNATNWLTAAKRYLANTYTVADTTGDPLSAWITTTTLYPSFALENHGFYHPTYEMVAGMSMGDSLLMARLANTNVAGELQAFAEHNVLNVWSNNLSAMVMGSGDFAYPSGIDWELHDYEQNSYIAWLASHFNDPVARWTDAQLAQLVQYRQMINGNGTFVGPSGGGFYREAVSARRTAIAWLHWYYADHPTGPTTAPPPTVVHYPDVKVILQRGTNGCVSISYGSRIMAMVEPAPGSIPTNAMIASPLNPGLIGLGALGNPSSAALIQLTTNAVGFDAELKLSYSSGAWTTVLVKSTGEAIGFVEVPFPPAGLTPTPSSSFDTGIENDPLTGGTRLIEWTGGSATVTNRSGTSRNISNSWVCVSGCFGLAAGPSGYFAYRAASGYNRLGAAQDTLEYFPQEPFQAHYAVYFPGKNAAQVSAAMAQVNWAMNPTNATLSFPGPGGIYQITADLAPAVPLYTPYVLPVASISASSTQSSTNPADLAADANLSTFWVSLKGPTNHAEWLLEAFPRVAAVSGVKVYPRTLNGGYGPKDILIVLNITNPIPATGIPTSGTNVFQGTMAALAPLEVAFDEPILATNGALIITSGYDRGDSSNPRNTQVVELMFLERALPGTFGDWAVRRFNDVELADPQISLPLADPDHDGMANLLEYAVGGDPLMPDATLGAMSVSRGTDGKLKIQYRERLDATGLQRSFQSSADLANWASISPISSTTVSVSEAIATREASFEISPAACYIRALFELLP